MAVVVALAACGRVGFDTTSHGQDGGVTGDGATAAPQLASLCGFDHAVALGDGVDLDVSVSKQLVDAVGTACASHLGNRSEAQGRPGVLDDSGRPLGDPRELIVSGGGDGPNREIAYLLASGDSPLVWSGTDLGVISVRRTGAQVVTGPISSHHDYAFLQVIAEPIGGTTTLSAQGFASGGTEAAAVYFAEHVAVGLASDADGWVVVEWTDADGDGVASSADTFAEIASGS